MKCWKDRLPAVVLNLLGLAALALFLLASGSGGDVVLLVVAVWLGVLAAWLVGSCFLEQRRLEGLLKQARQLEERYLLPEILPPPVTAEERTYRRLMELAEKSMLEKIAAAERERKEYREYIERWIHEIKTPITAGNLLCENHHSARNRELLAQLESITRYTEQALYYARSEHTEKDYLIREICLADLVHEAIAENKYLLRQNRVAVTVDALPGLVCTDDKWIRFVLDQLIGNAVKYRREKPTLHFFCESGSGEIRLLVEDNGIGIPPADLPRVFEKGFTGANGRAVHSSTGMGLYLCKRMCDKLGIGLKIDSQQGVGTTACLIFTVNGYITGVQG